MNQTIHGNIMNLRYRVITQIMEELEQLAKQRGAAAGLKNVDDDFEAYLVARLNLVYLAQYGEMGPGLEVLLRKREELRKELEWVIQTLRELEDEQQPAERRPALLIVRVLPSILKAVRRYCRRRAILRQAGRLENEVSAIGEMEWKETLRRDERDQFIEYRKQLLLSIYNYYRAGGEMVSQGRERNLQAIA